jgi:hypothetical protein
VGRIRDWFDEHQVNAYTITDRQFQLVIIGVTVLNAAVWIVSALVWLNIIVWAL